MEIRSERPLDLTPVAAAACDKSGFHLQSPLVGFAIAALRPRLLNASTATEIALGSYFGHDATRRAFPSGAVDFVVTVRVR